ncbi:Uncharacterised protein [Streptococcus pneumoniae]|nr:Uncharacterised protein [Streptococcus pneumoniae]
MRLSWHFMRFKKLPLLINQTILDVGSTDINCNVICHKYLLLD